MSQVMVFVDDAVLGRLPPICVKDGVPTDDQFVARQPVGNAGFASGAAALLLFLLGPLGWIALLVLAALQRGGADVLTIRLPLSEAAYRRLRRARRESLLAGVAMVALALLSVACMVSLFHHEVTGWLLGAAAAALATLAAARWVLSLRATRRERFRVDLDASRRWVTLSGVHPNFVEAVEHQRDFDGSLHR